MMVTRLCWFAPSRLAAVFRDHPVPPVEFLRMGGCIFHDLVVHDADFACHLLGEVPTKVGFDARIFVCGTESLGVQA
jgi:predicted dehydrogenase